MCKQLNGLLLKSLEPKRFGPNSEKNIDWTGTVKDFVFCFDPDRNSYVYFGPSRAEIAIIRVGLGLGQKNPDHEDL